MSLYFGDDELNNMHAAYAPRPIEYHFAPANYGQSVHPLKSTNHSDDVVDQDAKKADTTIVDSVNTGIEVRYRGQTASSKILIVFSLHLPLARPGRSTTGRSCTSTLHGITPCP